MKVLLATTSVAVAAALALGVGPASVTKGASAAWEPKKPVEFVVMAGKGGGRVAKELAGNNAHSTVNNPSEQLGFYQAGKTRTIAAFTPARPPLFADAPTFKELGKDFVYFMQRTVVGTPGMSKEAATYYR